MSVIPACFLIAVLTMTIMFATVQKQAKGKKGYQACLRYSTGPLSQLDVWSLFLEPGRDKDGDQGMCNFAQLDH